MLGSLYLQQDEGFDQGQGVSYSGGYRSVFMKKMKYRLLISLVLLMPALGLAGFDEAEEANRAGDRETAFMEYKLAALNGDIRAFGKLGGLYLHGVGTPKDPVMAYVWFGLSDLAGDRYAKGYQDAVAGIMTSAQFETAKERLAEYREKLGLSKKPEDQ
ncbi:sel1 repeat family protein [Solemya velesiana gill symbiont]|uniref:Sel1 repeat family protein n=1 Tax=Solemya velesiana gill symbiont TaxID=1918948 RepID=A0A1T2KSI6_9GAMM|nr:sel1 repeat family protein [Solemya velesiana gill symbiont]OOZ35656.1 hypothetical protein BOW51_11010 [Solemya velesiana gill symbiont]